MKQHLASDQSGDEEKLLVEEDLPPYATTRATWIRFCVVFGVLHACGMTSITYASSFLGKRESSGTLCLFFGAYTVSALLGATNVVRRKGALMSMVVGFGSYVLLCLSYAAYELLGAGAAADVVVAVSSLVAVCRFCRFWAKCQELIHPQRPDLPLFYLAAGTRTHARAHIRTYMRPGATQRNYFRRTSIISARQPATTTTTTVVNGECTLAKSQRTRH